KEITTNPERLAEDNTKQHIVMSTLKIVPLALTKQSTLLSSQTSDTHPTTPEQPGAARGDQINFTRPPSPCQIRLSANHTNRSTKPPNHP
ncbi:hypothetical protein, partial [Raineyella sp.]|uniref:hypothetical protein n=1 Tax=Raineyella sp. TaxID=1911550 RepID=UPI002B21148E